MADVAADAGVAGGRQVAVGPEADADVGVAAEVDAVAADEALDPSQFRFFFFFFLDFFFEFFGFLIFFFFLRFFQFAFGLFDLFAGFLRDFFRFVGDQAGAFEGDLDPAADFVGGAGRDDAEFVAAAVFPHRADLVDVACAADGAGDRRAPALAAEFFGGAFGQVAVGADDQARIPVVEDVSVLRLPRAGDVGAGVGSGDRVLRGVVALGADLDVGGGGYGGAGERHAADHREEGDRQRHPGLAAAELSKQIQESVDRGHSPYPIDSRAPDLNSKTFAFSDLDARPTQLRVRAARFRSPAGRPRPASV